MYCTLQRRGRGVYRYKRAERARERKGYIEMLGCAIRDTVRVVVLLEHLRLCIGICTVAACVCIYIYIQELFLCTASLSAVRRFAERMLLAV